ncbi:MAG: hypothetical protein AAGF92_10775 [Myxococcota bacterium]
MKKIGIIIPLSVMLGLAAQASAQVCETSRAARDFYRCTFTSSEVVDLEQFAEDAAAAFGQTDCRADLDAVLVVEAYGGEGGAGKKNSGMDGGKGGRRGYAQINRRLGDFADELYLYVGVDGGSASSNDAIPGGSSTLVADGDLTWIDDPSSVRDPSSVGIYAVAGGGGGGSNASGGGAGRRGGAGGFLAGNASSTTQAPGGDGRAGNSGFGGNEDGMGSGGRGRGSGGDGGPGIGGGTTVDDPSYEMWEGTGIGLASLFCTGGEGANNSGSGGGGFGCGGGGKSPNGRRNGAGGGGGSFVDRSDHGPSSLVATELRLTSPDAEEDSDDLLADEPQIVLTLEVL